ncbi:FAD-dependent monooxygenase [Dyadobacter crusticola]|uniref:FAD-dependent monooxygenase n=1 Tax=Dyadobacter crusticola TaxID=292407 RepID=UPI0004E0FB88|nr:FAD-dependent monooxygenase [Dyadobacter crusticola]
MNITIVGAGIAGLTASIAFKKAGYETTIFEAAPQITAAGAGLGLAPNAIRALSTLGIMEDIVPLGRKLPYFRILDRSGKIISENNSNAISDKFGLDNFTIHRHKLHTALLKHVDPASIFTNKKVTGLEKGGKKAKLYFADGSCEKTDYLVVADGINSLLRTKLVPAAVRRYAGYTCWRGVIDAPDLRINGASETWGQTGRFGIVPLADGKVYWFACIKAAENDAKYKAFTAEDLYQHFSRFHDPVPQILQTAYGSPLIHNDIYDLAPLDHYAFDNILLIGDAAHGATPNMGQGACQAIEDAATLLVELNKDQTLEKAFTAFEEKRLKRTQYIINQSRKVGELAQIGHPLFAGLRNAAMRFAPAWVTEKQFEKLYNITFEAQ